MAISCEFPTPRHGPEASAKNRCRPDRQREIGGHARNRTGVYGFAVRCVTTPPRGLESIEFLWCRPGWPLDARAWAAESVPVSTTPFDPPTSRPASTALPRCHRPDRRRPPANPRPPRPKGMSGNATGTAGTKDKMDHFAILIPGHRSGNAVPNQFLLLGDVPRRPEVRSLGQGVRNG